LKSTGNVGKINFVTGGPVALTPKRSILKCCGPETNRNASGLVLQVQANKGSILLTGDAGYDFIPAIAKNNLIGLTVPHHGGVGAGIPPAPKVKEAVATISYGIPNRYGHPNNTTINDHSLWSVKKTIYPGTRRRGDIFLP
jgi:beta-lactamase superfamily II metal-dependent hydrolase